MRLFSGRNLFSLIFLAVILYFVFFTGFNSNTAQKRTTTRLLMGTMVSITTWGVADSKEQQAVAAAFAEMARIEASMSSHQPQSQVAKINAEAMDNRLPVTAELAGLLMEAAKIQEISHGAFNPGLGKLIGIWGFSSKSAVKQPPKKEDIAAWAAKFKADATILPTKTSGGDGFTLSLPNSASSLDLGGIAKGYAIDRAIETLKKFAIKNALLNAGGDLRGIGNKGGKPWRVGIQHPRETQRVIAVSEWSTQPDGDMAMVTSGDYERFFFHEGRRYHHILNPHTGYPAESTLLSVSVQADNATLADGLSTAFFVLGEVKSRELLKKLPGVGTLFVREDGSHWQSPMFKGRWLGKP